MLYLVWRADPSFYERCFGCGFNACLCFFLSLVRPYTPSVFLFHLSVFCVCLPVCHSSSSVSFVSVCLSVILPHLSVFVVLVVVLSVCLPSQILSHRCFLRLSTCLSFFLTCLSFVKFTALTLVLNMISVQRTDPSFYVRR